MAPPFDFAVKENRHRQKDFIQFAAFLANGNKMINHGRKDFLFFNGITDKIDFASEWDTFQHLGKIKFSVEEISLVSQLLSERPDQITTSLSKGERIIMLKRIISLIYRIYSHMSKSVSRERF